MKINLHKTKPFEERHIGPSAQEQQEMLSAIGATDIEELISQTIPATIRLDKPMNIPAAQDEHTFLQSFKRLMSQNQVAKSYIGMGYHDCITPSVILRNILENPGWYTAYTPYQAEIAQGRLEMLLNFQTMITDLTGMEMANASLLDEGTAAAEALHMLHAHAQRKKKGATKCIISKNLNPQTIALIQTRMEPIGVELIITDPATADYADPSVFGLMVGYPNTNGTIHEDIGEWIESAKAHNIWVTVVADLLSLTLLKSPGEMGADVVVGLSQRFGVPMGFGGPHAAFFATKEEFSRLIPGRIIGVSKDASGKPAMRMALQTREQHIKRERATSNICTAQVLLSVMAAAYAVYHGPEGLKDIAKRTHGMAVLAQKALAEQGIESVQGAFFDTLKLRVGTHSDQLRQVAEAQLVNFRYFQDGHVGISVDETTTVADIQQIAEIFSQVTGKSSDVNSLAQEVELNLPENLHRTRDFMTHPVFELYHSEHEMLRYLKRLENKDISLTHSMISLGSCTMKLNATSEMIPVTWPEVGKLHPYAPLSQTQGYQKMFENLSNWLCEATGFDAVSLQPNSGAQGEYAGLMTIRGYHLNNGHAHRDVVLIPSSAHGTNPASGVMAGMKVTIVKCDEQGNVDLADLKAKAEAHSENLAALMVTYPSTHGVFEEDIIEICDTIHQYGGRVYMDGANMNAQVGLTNPARIGADVCHLNLHKTFCIPHGGGGPGMGPIGVVSDLAPFLPGNPMVKTGGEKAIGPVSAAPYGSASILPISYAYIAMMGGDGLKRATEVAILNANYIKERLKGQFDALYTGKNGRAAHEMIIDCRDFKKVGVEVEDIAKRLMDYGYHAPTVSFPVAGTMMIEPTESESKAELDRFCDVMIQIRKEIAEVENSEADPINNVLKNAPHTSELVVNDEWHMPYSRQKAAFPLPYLVENKIWPSVRRVDNAYGDRNLMCSCIPVEEYA